jgi:hypothetical protein
MEKGKLAKGIGYVGKVRPSPYPLYSLFPVPCSLMLYNC